MAVLPPSNGNGAEEPVMRTDTQTNADYRPLADACARERAP